MGEIFYRSTHRTDQTHMVEILKLGMWNFKEGFLKKNFRRTYRMALNTRVLETCDSILVILSQVLVNPGKPNYLL